MADPFVTEIFESLRGLGELRSRRMFGGVGLYANDVFFGLIARGALYFKVDEGNLPAYEAAGSAPFRPFEDRPGANRPGQSMGYYEVPDGVMERPADLLEWARAALEAAVRRDIGKTQGAQRSPRSKSSKSRGAATLRSLKNIGPKSAGWLEASGFRSRSDLERSGAVEAYRTLLEDGVTPNLNLLYALEGALLDMEITRLPEAILHNLRVRLGEGRTRRRKS